MEKVNSGSESNNDAANSGRHVNVTGMTNVSKAMEIIESDNRYTIRNVSKAVGILLSPLNFI